MIYNVGMMKKSIVILIAVICSVVLAACAKNEKTEDFTFELSVDGTSYTLVKCNVNKSKVEIPSTYNDNPIVKIGDEAFLLKDNIKELTIPDCVTEIGERAFFNCGGLEDLQLPNGLTSLGRFAFGQCDELRTVKFPSALKSIGYGAFGLCNNLISVELPDELESIDDSAFESCYSLLELDCPDSLVSIGMYAFKNSGLVRVRFNTGLRSVGYGAFTDCGRLIETQNFDESFTPNGYAGDIGLFGNIWHEYGETGESEISIDDDGYVFYTGEMQDESYDNVDAILIAYIGESEDLQFPENYSDRPYGIHDNALKYNKKITSINIPDTVEFVERQAFKYCGSLNEVYIGARRLDYEIFSGCDKLKAVTIGKSCRDLGYNAMIGMTEVRYTGTVNDWLNVKIECSFSAPFSENCVLYIDGQPLKSVTVPGSINSVPEYIFNGISTLESVTIEEGVREIRKNAFACCYALKHVSLPSSLVYIGYYAFGGCKNLNMQYYEGGWYLGNSSDPYVALMRTKEVGGMDSIVVPSAAGDTVTIHPDTRILYDHSLNGRRDAASVTIPDNVVCIGYCALNGMANIEELVLPDTVMYVGDEAFSGCARLESITIPSGITKFSYHMLYGCGSLKEIRYKSGVDGWKRIEKYSTHWNDNTGDYTVICQDGNLAKE